jgi:hypothetical protein
MTAKSLGFGLPALAFMLLPAMALAQSAVAGSVKDSSGGVLPGVTVEASSPVLIEKVRTAVTDGQGLYRIVDLRPGPYTVTFSLPGFATVRREGIDIPSDFTATVNAEMNVGSLEETLTVTGEAPLVDVQSTQRSTVYSNEVLEGLPTSRMVFNLAMYVPGVVGGLNEVGPQQTFLTVHGSRRADVETAIDGMSTRRSQTSTFYMNEGSVQEISVQTDGSTAETQLSGIWMNAVPKDGGNTFRGSLIFHFSDESLAGDNLTDSLRAQGLTAVNGLKRNIDFNPNGGGPIVEDKLWFYGAYRYNQVDKWVADSFYDVDPLDWVYTPDRTRQAVNNQLSPNYALRLTWQATPRNKLSLNYEMNKRLTARRRAAATVSPEATTYTPFNPNALGTISWKAPISNRLMLDTGFMAYSQDWDERVQRDPAVPQGTISATEDSTGQIFRSSPVYGHNLDHPLTFRSSLAYVTGSHNYKLGFTLRKRGAGNDFTSLAPMGDMTFNLLNGVPRQITLFATPIEYHNDLNADLGIFAQDSWTTRRLTINYGVRFDYLHGSVPEQHLAAGQFVPARDFAAIDNLPLWKDINPRLGVSYDVFGNGRTAIKGTIGRYITGGTLGAAANPVNTAVNSATRTWTDGNGNFVPDCDLRNPAANLECGSISNNNFGKANPDATQYDPDVLVGWGKRPYSWMTSLAVQHQLLNSLSIDAGYFHRTFGNFTATDNTLVVPSDYDPFCVTAPTFDSRLPVAGQSICGFYDITPAKRGISQNLVTFADRFGEQIERYDGVDLSTTLRVAGGGMLTAGTSTGRIAASNCFVIDSPQQLYNCDQTAPFRTQWKFFGVYPVKYGLSVSATLQIVPSPAAGGLESDIIASYAATNAEILPTLGRNLAAGANSTVIIPNLMKPYQLPAQFAKQLDLRLAKSLPLAQDRRIQLTMDVYNVLNRSDMQALNTRLGRSASNNLWQRPNLILQARYFQFGAQVDF